MKGWSLVIFAVDDPRHLPGLESRPRSQHGEGSVGVVIAAGASAEARALLGNSVAVLGGAMYSQYRCLAADQCLLLPAGATPADGAASFVNPLTALGMVETMRREGHTALVHTAAASNLGQMLNRVCRNDGIGLVNIVRKREQVDLLKSMGATHVCDASSSTFLQELTDALATTGATIGFDATGGGKLAGQILGCMEDALNRASQEYSRDGSTTHKQLYLYGGLDTSPTEFVRNFGMAWGMGGWLLFSVPSQDRHRGSIEAEAASGGRTEDDLLEPLRRRALAGRGTTTRMDHGLRPTGHGDQVPDKSKQGHDLSFDGTWQPSRPSAKGTQTGQHHCIQPDRQNSGSGAVGEKLYRAIRHFPSMVLRRINTS